MAERTAHDNTGVQDLSGREAIAAALAVAGEAIVVLLSFSRDVPPSVPLLMHAIVVAAVSYVLLWGRSTTSDKTVSYVMLLVTAVAGPAGAVASLCALPFVGHAGAGQKVLDEWYDRLSSAGGVLPETAMHDRINAGRVLDWQAPAPHDFLDIITNGSLSDKQQALGLMARTFHTDFAPALQAALRSPEPVVRVQAAAVVARVRADLKARIRTLTAMDGKGKPLSIQSAAELMRFASCPLVDRADQDRCRIASGHALVKALVSEDDVVAAAAKATPGTAPVVEAFLLERRRFKEFRVARRIHDLVTVKRFRVRRLQASEAAS